MLLRAVAGMRVRAALVDAVVAAVVVGIVASGVSTLLLWRAVADAVFAVGVAAVAAVVVCVCVCTPGLDIFRFDFVYYSSISILTINQLYRSIDCSIRSY